MSDLLRDPLDFAAELSEREREHNTAEVRRKAGPKQVRNADGSWPQEDCEDCGDPIGHQRLEATGSNICIGCATERELRGKQYAKR